jgi:hypothetical protein
MFKICAKLVHGTRGHLNQIQSSLSSQQEIKCKISDILDSMLDDRFKMFMLHEHNKQSKTDHLIYPQKFE